MSKRIVIRIGNVFCIEIDGKYKCYFQYVCNDKNQLNSSIVRVFKSRHPTDYKPVLEEIITDEVSFYAHTVLRIGIQFGAWYKVGKPMSIENSEHENIIWGTASDILDLTAWDFKTVNPMDNWRIWSSKKIFKENYSLPRKLMYSIEYGAVLPYIEIVNRIKYGYYKNSSPVYSIIKRIPHPDVHSYVKRETNETVKYMHFLGENVMQEIIIKEDSLVGISGGYLLDRPKFWETNWDFDDFITEDEFNEAWDKYSQ